MADNIGSVADMTSEKPYIELNQFINAMVPHGRSYYMTGATVIRPSGEMAKQVSALQAELIKDHPSVRSMIGFELFSLKKVNTVSNDAMAFCCRGPHINVLVNLSWGHEGYNGEEVDFDPVRAKGKDIVTAIQSDRLSPEAAYGNYGQSSHMDTKPAR